MPVRILTPKRAFSIFVTATLISVLNLIFNSKESASYLSVEEYYLERILSGPISQADPLLVSWVQKKIVPPSNKPYNLEFHFSGINNGKEDENFFSPSQDFILSKVEEILGDEIERGGSFIEAGAYNGEFLSNTLSLEYSYGWKGILVEPHPKFFNQLLSKNRKSWAINACLSYKPWPSKEYFASVFGDPSTNHLLNGIVTNASVEKEINRGSSGLLKFVDSKKIEEKFLVQCIPLYTILKALKMSHVDFFSLDVERAEMGILESLPWEKVSFSILAIEHKSLPDLKSFFLSKGYVHVESQNFDHIFVNKKMNFQKRPPSDAYQMANQTQNRNSDRKLRRRKYRKKILIQNY
ncbi:UNVERIFIED_CONTAM: hypothetical protein RMT77_003513 [Armadillidium vulgare]